LCIFHPSSSNGVTTPKPIQSGMVGNCNTFYLVQPGDGCAAIASKNGITLAQFYAWNTQVGTGCPGLWANTYACVGVIGFVRSSPTTSEGNGITTPTPIQTGMTGSCKKFYFVKSGDSCVSIAGAVGVSLDQFLSWNPAAGGSCAALWANTYCCIAVL
jgi:LysM domain